MVIAAPEPKEPVGEQRVVLRSLSWEAYLHKVPKERLYAFLEEAKEDEIEAVRSLRTWWQQSSIA